MNTLAFCVIAFMLTAYVLSDGYDLGIGTIAPAIARSQAQRAALMESIGPFWNGNEVWLIASGAALFALFPAAYASSFSGFYLPFVVLLWLLMFRGIALELREHFPSRLWRGFWDAAFTAASALLILIFGIALGNLVRGLPLDASGYFQGTFGYLLNPYALLVGVFALAVLAQHGAAFAALRIEGPPAKRARAASRRLLWIVAALFGVVSAATFTLRGAPSGPTASVVLPLLALGSLVWYGISIRTNRTALAFVASCVFVAMLLATAAATLYPYLLRSTGGSGGISIFDAAPAPVALSCALAVTIAGSVAVLTYSSLVWRRMAGKVRVE